MCTVKCIDKPCFFYRWTWRCQGTLYNYSRVADIRVVKLEPLPVRTAPSRKSKEPYAECGLSMLLDR